jgi:hypothetical protein
MGRQTKICRHTPFLVKIGQHCWPLDQQAFLRAEVSEWLYVQETSVTMVRLVT